MTVYPVEPAGPPEFRHELSFLDGEDGFCGLRLIRLRHYPPTLNGERLKGWRRENVVSIRLVAEAVGLTCREVSELEQSRSTMDEGDWLELWSKLDGVRRD